MRIGILGGGIAGLACAHYLLKLGHTPVVLERSEHHGELTRRFPHGGGWIDSFHELIHPSDTALVGLIADVGGLDRLVWREVRFGAVAGGSVVPEHELLARAALPLRDRVRGRLAYTYITRLVRYGPRLDRISASQWVARLSGARVRDRLLRPVLEARYGDSADEVPAQTLWTQMRRARWGDRAVRGYVRGGYHWLGRRLRQSIEERGGEVLLHTNATGLDWEDGRAIVSFGETARPASFEALISTVPPHSLAKLARGSLMRDLPFEVPYQGVVNAVVVSRAPLREFCTTTVLDEGHPFHTLAEATHVVPFAQTGGRHLLYLTRYCAPETPQYLLPDDLVVKQAREMLARLYPDLDPGMIEHVEVSRAPDVEPLWTVGASGRRPPIRLPNSRVYLSTSAHAYPRATCWDTAVMVARGTCSKLHAEA